jgi:hypothetical protein
LNENLGEPCSTNETTLEQLEALNRHKIPRHQSFYILLDFSAVNYTDTNAIQGIVEVSNHFPF